MERISLDLDSETLTYPEGYHGWFHTLDRDYVVPSPGSSQAIFASTSYAQLRSLDNGKSSFQAGQVYVCISAIAFHYFYLYVNY